MTQIQNYPIECQCGNLVDVKIYQSVNVTVDESLLGKVKKRKINNYKCEKCGATSELAYQFLYVDMKKKQWIWCYPEAERNNLDTIEKELSETRVLENMLEKLGQPKPLILFGYDELLAKIG